ncbi:MAG: AIR synthase-related protein, partial [Syntrophomonadaceae bacterium]|nr:AIR synthase-related protein [Syntrophomonadaceae bacterium]
TGFGLLGHCYELSAASGVSAELFTAGLPFIHGVHDAAGLGLLPAGAYVNRDHFIGHIDGADVEPDLIDLLFSPETAGGLLISVAADKSEALDRALQSRACLAVEVGRITEKFPHAIKLRP